MSQKILIIEDDHDICQLLKRFLTKHGFTILLAYNGKQGIATALEEKLDLILCDFRLGDLDGFEVLKRVKDANPDLPFIMITGYSDIRVAVNVMKMGALDYVTKPLFPDEILLTIRKALNSDNVENKENSTRIKKSSIKENYTFGNSPQSKSLVNQIELVAPTNYSVIIYGESGAGKEAVAQTIHMKSPRANHPFIAMDCGAISKELAGSELFGHEKGSFTGALNTKIGHFELANGGTLFLDEVSNLPYEVQSSLLRVVQERKVKRIGGTKEIGLDVRIIIASNENLADAYKKGKFREDLFHRFNEFSLDVPPLRERDEDIMTYAYLFLKSANQELKRNITDFEDEVIEIFKKYPWYGNLRELKNVIKRSALLSEGNKIQVKALPFEIANFSKLQFPENNHEVMLESNILPIITQIQAEKKEESLNLKVAASEAEYELIMKVLKQVNFNKSKAAKLLYIDRKTLYNKMKSYDI